ncbi:uncharacterized protein [Triticum aestivum]|uniref:uncharacterized protein isoform X2 n=1 Tax=Triticum aestivum TaxID=4565 RepID=UPI001D019ADE|nr:uncharacterized protein LOC123057719 isoform X2 [Triticum aestivum]
MILAPAPPAVLSLLLLTSFSRRFGRPSCCCGGLQAYCRSIYTTTLPGASRTAVLASMCRKLKVEIRHVVLRRILPSARTDQQKSQSTILIVRTGTHKREHKHMESHAPDLHVMPSHGSD